MGSIEVEKPVAPTFVTPDAAPIHPLERQSFDVAGIGAKYVEERAKRIRSDGTEQFIRPEGDLAHLKADVWARSFQRDPINADTKVLIVGAGFGGIGTAVKLKQNGVENFAILDKAGGFGGAWYWNQYPGVTCDVEAEIYLPFIEETGYIPKSRFAYGTEIREHLSRVVDKWNLTPHAHLQTQIISMTWDESIKRWHVHTDRNDHFKAQFVVLATGNFHDPKLPGIEGINTFKRDHFHSSRWNYNVTGGNGSGGMTKLANKTVGIIGTGASGAQLVPKLAQDAKKLYVFQRTPSSVIIRENWPTNASVFAAQKPGWQQKKMDIFSRIFQGEVIMDECSGLEGMESAVLRTLFLEGAKAGVTVTPEMIPKLYGLMDFRAMEGIRKLIDDKVRDKSTAEKLKPWYPFMCKRPVFQNEYLDAFNNPNVELVDTNGKGVTRITETGVIANDKEYEVDLLIYSTGYDFDLTTSFERGTGIKVKGTKGRSPDDVWKEKGPSTLFGIHMREFPNFLNIGLAQSGVGANWLHSVYSNSEHIAEFIETCLKEDIQAVEPTPDAQEDWGKQIEEGAQMKLQFAQACTPGYYTNEGKPEEMSLRLGVYPKGIVAWTDLLREWREEGSMKGMEKR